MRALLATVVIVAFARVAAAHPLDLGYLRITQARDTVVVTLDLDVNAAAILVGATSLDAPAAAAGAATLAAATLSPIATPAGLCTWGAATATLVARTVTVASTATCPVAGERRWAFPFVQDHRISTKFELLVKQIVGDSERLTLVDPSNSEIILAATAAPAAPEGPRGQIVALIAISAIAAFCAILQRWLRRSTSTT